MLVPLLSAVLVLLTVTVGCALVPPAIGTDYSPGREEELLDQVLRGPGEPITQVDTLELNSDLKEYVDNRISRRWGPRRKLESLRKMLFGKENLNIQYDNAKTKTAIETFESRVGNCLSITNLFISAARYVDLDAHFQVVAIKPTWERSGSSMIRNEHINAIGKFSQGMSYTIDFLPQVFYDEPKTYSISDDQALALYYSNLGAEYIVNGNPALALRYLRVSISIDPDQSDGWNNMGAAQRRLGNKELAEFSYLRAIQLDGRNYTAMSNLARFYRESGDQKRADHYLKRVENFRSQNPYYLYFEARTAFENQDYKTALHKLKKAIVKKDNEADFYVALAKTYRQMGDLRRSDATMAKAIKFIDSSHRSDYDRKMEILIH